LVISTDSNKHSQLILEKYANIKFQENPSSGSRVPRGRIDRQTYRS